MARDGGNTPTLLTSMSRPPNARTARSVDGDAAPTRRSHRTRRGSSRRRSDSASGSTSTVTTAAPCAASSRRDARPMPLAAPVTSATRPSNGLPAPPFRELGLLELPVLDVEQVALRQRTPAAERFRPLDRRDRVARRCRPRCEHRAPCGRTSRCPAPAIPPSAARRRASSSSRRRAGGSTPRYAAANRGDVGHRIVADDHGHALRPDDVVRRERPARRDVGDVGPAREPERLGSVDVERAIIGRPARSETARRSRASANES